MLGFWERKRTLYPINKTDRIFFWFTVFIMLFSVVIGVRSGLAGLGWSSLGILVPMTFVAWFLLYLVQEVPIKDAAEEYTEIIGRIAGMESQLSELSSFLKRERQKIQDSEATLGRLQDEKSKIEPIVRTQRETVEAILAAHATRISATAWKERIIGFVLGAIASLAASIVYEYIKH